MTKQRYILLIMIFFLSLCTTGYSQDRDQGRSNYIFGVFAYEKGDYEGAEKEFKKALDLEPDNPLYISYMGKTYFQMERYNDALYYLNRAWSLDPEISGLKYDLAMASYRLNDYKTALGFFDRVIDEEPANVLAHYHAGISLYREQEYGKALSHFLEASEKSPTIKANGYYYAGICQARMGDRDRAVEKLEYARDHSESAAIRESAAKWLDAIEREKKALKPYSLLLKTGYQSDSNVLLETDDDTVSDRDDTAFVGYFSGKYRFLTGDYLRAGIGYSHYQIFYNNIKEYNLTSGIFNLYCGYDKGPLGITLTYLPHFSWLDSEKYMQKQGGKTDVTFDVTDNLVTRLSYSYYDINHIMDDNRDGSSQSADLKAYYIFRENGGYIFAGVGYEDRDAEHPDYVYSLSMVQGGVSLKIPLDFTLNITGTYRDVGYDNVDSGYQIKRQDKRYSGSLSLSRSLFYEWLSISGEFDYTKRKSNIVDYEYSRKVANLSLIVTF